MSKFRPTNNDFTEDYQNKIEIDTRCILSIITKYILKQKQFNIKQKHKLYILPALNQVISREEVSNILTITQEDKLIILKALLIGANKADYNTIRASLNNGM